MTNMRKKITFIAGIGRLPSVPPDKINLLLLYF